MKYGFRIVGNCFQRRRLVDARAAYEAYCRCDDKAEVHKEAYLSAFTFGTEFCQQLDATGSTKGYDGPCGSMFIHWDVDRDDLDVALADTRRLANAIRDRYVEPIVYYSGSKGFHVDLAVNYEPSIIFNRVAKTFALAVAESVSIDIDRRVFDKVRAFRAPNSRHAKTGRHKVRLTFDELALDLATIQQLADQPRPFEPVYLFSEHTEDDWIAAVAEVEKQIMSQVAPLLDARLNRLTLEFIRDGAKLGERANLLFSAAANLGEFGCPAALAHALLTESALDSGLAPNEVQRQIECGLAHIK